MADGVVVRVVLFVGIVSIFSMAFAKERKITIEEKHCPNEQPQCKHKNYSIVHVVAESIDGRSTIHYLWSVIYSPTIIVAYFEKPGVNVSIDWNNIFSANSKGINFTERSEYITALVIPAFYEFQDPKDELYYTKKDVTDIVKHQFNKVDWEKPEIDYKNNITTFKASMLGGIVIFQCNASFNDGRESLLPQQQFSSNSTIFTLTLDRLKRLNKTGNTRFIFELSSFTADPTQSTTCIKADKFFDDEYTPAVFKTIVVNSTGVSGMSFSAWKPVAYINKMRSLDHQVPSYQYIGNKQHFIGKQCLPLSPSSVARPSFSIAYKLGVSLLSYGMNVSFGQQKDGWYDGSHYLSWSAMVAYGTPLPEKLSTVVLIIIIVGFGMPMLVIVISVVYVIAKKLKARNATSSYGMIN